MRMRRQSTHSAAATYPAQRQPFVAAMPPVLSVMPKKKTAEILNRELRQHVPAAGRRELKRKEGPFMPEETVSPVVASKSRYPYPTPDRDRETVPDEQARPHCSVSVAQQSTIVRSAPDYYSITTVAAASRTNTCVGADLCAKRLLLTPSPPQSQSRRIPCSPQSAAPWRSRADRRPAVR